MIDLITRLEQAEAGSRELDALVWAATHGFRIDPIMAEQLAGVCATENGTPVVAEAVTTSLDAVTALIGEKLPGWHWTCALSFNCPGQPEGRPFYADLASKAWVMSETEKEEHAEVFAATPALALCIALLRAIKEGEHG